MPEPKPLTKDIAQGLIDNLAVVLRATKRASTEPAFELIFDNQDNVFVVTLLQTPPLPPQAINDLKNGLQRLVDTAKNRGVILTAQHFAFKTKNEGSEGAASAAAQRHDISSFRAYGAASNETSASQVEASRGEQEAPSGSPSNLKNESDMGRSEPSTIGGAPMSSAGHVRASKLTEVARRLKMSLREEYTVEVGGFKGKPAINITPIDPVSRILDASGIVQIEPQIAATVVAAFQKQGVELQQGDIVVSGSREADIEQIKLPAEQQRGTKEGYRPGGGGRSSRGA